MGFDIKDFFAKEFLVGAPLAGITNYPFRKLVRRFHNGLIFTEMVSVEGLKRLNKKSIGLIDISSEEINVGIQLFGGEPESYENAIKFIQDNFTPFCIDINMGCPVKKVLKSKAGAYLLTDLNRAKRIIETATKVSKIPISVKIRLGWDEKNMIYKELANIIENEGVSFLTVHGRTKSQLYSGHVQYDKIAEIKSLLKIPVIGNGDVVDLKTLEYMKNTGVDAVMIGRGMMKSPWIFEALNNGREPLHYLSGDKIIDILNDFLMDWKIYKGEKHYLEPFKKFVIWFSKGYKNSSHFRTEVYATDGEDSLVSLYTEFFKKAELISSHN